LARRSAAARAWAQKSGYSQFTQAAISTDGLQFDASPAITRTPYLRVIQYGGYYYGVSRLGRVSRSKDPLASFELGPNPFREGPYAGRIRTSRSSCVATGSTCSSPRSAIRRSA
jgi:hypothetical protein